MIRANDGHVDVMGNGLEILMDYSMVTTSILNAMLEDEEDTPEARAEFVKLLTSAFEIGIDAFHEGRKHAGTEENLQA